MSRVRAAFAFTSAVLRAVVRDRVSLFFMAVLPVVVIVVIGTTFGGQYRIELGVVAPAGSELGERFLDDVGASDAFEVARYDRRDELADAVRRRSVDAGVVLPDDVDAALGGTPVDVEVLTTADADALTIRTAVSGAVDRMAATAGATSFTATRAGIPVGQAYALVDELDAGRTPVAVVDVGGSRVRQLSDFSLVVPQNLVLFTFINATASAAFLVRSRREGVLRRAVSSPTGMATLLAGFGIGWFAVALFQSLLIVVVGWLAFGMDWGDPLAATALVVLWALVGCGAGLLVGAVGANEDRVSSIAPIVGIVLGALGGCMVPFEVFSATMQRIARAVPHTWALNGWRNVVFDGGGLTDIAGSLAVLAAWALGLLAVATVVLRRRLTSGA